MSEGYRYHLSYTLESHPDGITKEELRAQKRGGCDALMLMASIITPPDGSLSVQFFSMDGRTGEELPDSEWFKIWSMMSKRLAESKTLGEGRKLLAEAVWKTIRDAVLQGGPHA